MRGTDKQTAQMFSYLSPEAMVPQDYPLRAPGYLHKPVPIHPKQRGTALPDHRQMRNRKVVARLRARRQGMPR